MNGWIGSLHGLALTSRKMPVAIRYLITVAIVFIVMGAWMQTDAHAQRYPFLIFIPVIFACGALFDRGNGFLATILSAGASDYYMLPPVGSLTVASGDDQIALALFVVVGFAIAAVVEALHVGLVDLAIEHERAQTAVKDRELLLEELSHRTRNDLANVVTLLNLQARSAEGAAREALVSAADRVQTIARMHRRLEIYNNRVVVDTKSYIGELCSDLRLSRLASRPIALECDAESHSISIEKAVPLGLIVNESVTNAAKHAFPDERQGAISVRFVRVGDFYTLTIADNGVGAESAASGGGIGSRLMQMLAAQLGSKITTEPRMPGTAVVVTIAVKTAK
jgi:two-component sensor histidine kinase